MAKEKKETTPNTKGIPKWLIVLVVVLVLLFACGSAASFIAYKIAGKVVQKVVENKTGAKFDIKDGAGSIKVENKEGSMEIGTSAKWPEDMPTIVPQITFGKISAAFRSNNSSGKAWSVLVKDASKANADTYLADLKSKDWKDESQVDMTISIYQLSNGIYKLNLVFDPSSNGVNLTVEENTATE
jgi:hypothetical protein